MPKMPESEKKEESAESREEAKEQMRGLADSGLLVCLLLGETQGSRSQEDRKG